MANSDPHPIFFKPVKDAIRSTLVSAGLPELNISFNSIERDGILSATILQSRQIPPVMNRTQEVPSRKKFAWVDSTGANRERIYCNSLILHFDVQIKAPSIAQVLGFFFEFCRLFPRSIPDGHRLADPLAPSYGEFLGNPLELSMITPLFPDDTVVTAKDYSCSWIVRAEGGVYFDSPARVSVTPVTHLAPGWLS